MNPAKPNTAPSRRNKKTKIRPDPGLRRPFNVNDVKNSSEMSHCKKGFKKG